MCVCVLPTHLLGPPLSLSSPSSISSSSSPSYPFLRLTSLVLYFSLGSILRQTERKWDCFPRSMAIPLGVNVQSARVTLASLRFTLLLFLHSSNVCPSSNKTYLSTVKPCDSADICVIITRENPCRETVIRF